MTPDEIRQLIHDAADPSGRLACHALSRTVQGSWPGGTRDRYVPGGLGWLTRWHPERLGAELRDCSCASGGHCAVCN